MGIAKDTDNANLQIAHASGATALTLRTISQTSTHLTASGATYTAWIVDGNLTESTACSGNLTATTDGSTIACAALTNAHSANAYVYFQLTASPGPTAYISVTKVDDSDAYAQLYDTGFRGSQADIYGAQQGTRSGDVNLEGSIFPDTFGYLLASLTGAYDYTATSGTVPTFYAFSPLNTGNGQPNPYLFYVYQPSNSNTRVYAKAVATDMTVKLDPGALATHTTTIKTFASGVVANPSSVPPAFSTFTPLPSRVGSATIAGTANYKVQNAEFSFKRNAAGEVSTLQGIPDPLAIFVGPLAVSAKAVLVVDDDTELNRYISQSQPSFAISARIGSGAAATDNGILITCTKSNYENVKVVKAGGWVTAEVPFRAIANSTDPTTAGGGLSPVRVTLYTKTTGTSTLY